MAQLKLTGDPSPLLRLHPVLPQVRAQGQDRGVRVPEHRSAATWAEPRVEGSGEPGAHPRARGLGHRDACAREVHVPPVQRPAPGRQLRPGQAQRTTSASTRTSRTTSSRLSVDYNAQAGSASTARARTSSASRATRNDEAIQPTWQGATQTDIAERNRHILSGLVTLTPIDKLAVSLNGAKTDERLPGVGDRPPRPDLRHVRRGRDVRRQRQAQPHGRLRLREVLLRHGRRLHPARRAPAASTRPTSGSNATNDKVDTFRAGLVVGPRAGRSSTSTRRSTTRSRAATRSTTSPLPGTPIGGLNEANGIFPANVPPVPGFPVTTFDSFPLVTKKFIMAKIRLAYHISKNLTASAMYWKQKYDNTDWQTDLDAAVHGPASIPGRTAGSSSAPASRATTRTSSGPRSPTPSRTHPTEPSRTARVPSLRGRGPCALLGGPAGASVTGASSPRRPVSDRCLNG